MVSNSVNDSVGHGHGLRTAPTSLADLRDAAIPFRIRLNSQFRGVTVREGWLLKGSRGWGEFAPFDDYSDALAARWLQAAVDAAWGEPLPVVRPSVPVNAIVPSTTVERTEQIVRDAVLRGCTTMKIKVATADSVADVAAVTAVRAVLNRELGVGKGSIRLDANAAWSMAEARELLPRLVDAAAGIEYVEQPCAQLHECAELRDLSIAPVAVDEGLRLAANLDSGELVQQLRAAADVLIVKPIPLGGIAQVLAITEQTQLPVVVSGSLDSSIGLMYGVRAAATLPELAFACGLGTGALLAEDLVAEPVLPEAGHISVHDVEPDFELLNAHRIPRDDARLEYWQRRLADSATHLSGFGSVEP